MAQPGPDRRRPSAGRRVAGLGLSFVVGLGLAIWSANAGMKTMLDALNAIYEKEEKRGFVTFNAVSLGVRGAVMADSVGPAAP